MNKTYLTKKSNKILRLIKNLSKNIKILKSELESDLKENNVIKIFLNNLGELLSKISIFIYQMEKIQIFLTNSLEEKKTINNLLNNVNLLDNKKSYKFNFKFSKLQKF